jgi:hypothetical protein
MTEAPVPELPPTGDKPVSLWKILQENPFLVKMLIFFFLMLFVPLVLAWKFDLFLVAN